MKKMVMIVLLIIAIVIVGVVVFSFSSDSDVVSNEVEEFCFNRGNEIMHPGCIEEYAVLQADTSVCNTIEENLVENCEELSEGGSPACEPIRLEGNVNLLVSSCIARVATERRDSSLCDEIEATTFRELCYGELGILLLDSSLCDRVGDETDDATAIRETCYRKVAIETGDSFLCGKIFKRISFKEECLEKS